MNTTWRRFRLEPLAWIALAAFIGYRIWPQVGAAFGIDSANVAAPAFRLTTLDGQPVSSDALRGRVVLVNFWATWCAPCRIEMPGFQKIYDANRAKGFVVLGISTDAAGRDAVDRFLAEHHVSYPVAMATGEVVQQFGGANMLPTSFLIDRRGRIRNEVRGIFASAALAPAVARLLAEPGPSSGASSGASSGTSTSSGSTPAGAS